MDGLRWGRVFFSAHVNQDSIEIRQNRLASSAAKMLSDGALALLAAYAIVVAFDMLPIRLLNPAWQITFASALSGNMTIAFVGLAFLHVAAWMTPMSNPIQAKRDFFCGIARWAMVGFLFLLPLIGYATYTGVRSIKNQNEAQLNAARVTTKRLIQVIDSSASPGELQANMLALSGPRIPNEYLNESLPLLKQQSKILVNQAFESYLKQNKSRGSDQFLPLYVQAGKAFLMSLVGAFTSAALSWNSIKQQSMLGEIVMGDFQQLKFALNPKRMIANYKLNQEQRSLTEDARKRVREIEQQRQVEARKNAAAARKQSLERKREMDKFIKEEKRKRSNRID